MGVPIPSEEDGRSSKELLDFGIVPSIFRGTTQTPLALAECVKMLRSLASRTGVISRALGGPRVRTLVSRGGVSITDRKADPRFIDAAVNTVSGEVGYDQLEPHELTRFRADREKQLDIRNFTLNFGPQHPVRISRLTNFTTMKWLHASAETDRCVRFCRPIACNRA